MVNTAALICSLCGAAINPARDVYHIGNGAHHSSYDECVRAHERRQGPPTDHKVPAHVQKLAGAIVKPAGNINVMVLDIATLRKLAKPKEQPKERWYKRLFRRKR